MMATRNENQIELKTYQDMLEELKILFPEKHLRHLLLGNGFNLSLGVNTRYEIIFKEMKKRYTGYEKIEPVFENECDRNIEKLIEKMTDKLAVVLKDRAQRDFLPDYIRNEIKWDFIKATSTIVKDKVNKIYQVKSKEIHSLLEGFTNYFTLNYDPFLYLLLMKFAKRGNDEDQGNLAIPPGEAGERLHEIYDKIRSAFHNGTLTIWIDGEEKSFELDHITKGEFIVAVKLYFKSENWRSSEITHSANKFWEEEKSKSALLYELQLDHGFNQDHSKVKSYYDDNPGGQNLFFLHGAFHIHEDSKGIYKIKGGGYTTLYQKIEESVHSEEEDVVCVFRNDNKLSEITKNPYLKVGYQKLSTLRGALVIIGSSLAENDTHIFKQIDSSGVDSIYIASSGNRKRDHYDKANALFSNKRVTLFDRGTIFTGPIGFD